ncbi:MAG: hypothetical protein RLY86_1595 [Pseudomonadota bacterium]|jgi:MFS family permease
MTETVARTAEEAGEKRYRAYVLFVLLLVYIFNFIDRQIIGILAPLIKADLGLSDTQLGLMGGLAFALFYTGLGIPIAMLADRYSRVKIITIALAVWSAFTVVCGFAHNFWQLFLARVGVGVGEAGGVAPAYSLISDYFPQSERGRAMAVFSFGIPIGSAAGILFGGLIAAYIDWRMAFIVVGLAGLLLAPLMWFTVKEPVRGRFDPPTAARAKAPAIGEVLSTLTGKSSFWFISFGASASSIMGYGLIFWLPSFFKRSYGPELETLARAVGFGDGVNLTLVGASLFFGTIIFFGGLLGIWMGGYLADKLGQAKKSAYALVPAAAFALAIPFFAAGVLAPTLTIAFFLFLLPQALSLVWLGPVLSSIQGLVAPAMRATASAVFLFVNNLLGIGFGTFFLGFLSDTLIPRFGDDSLRYSILIGLSFYALAFLLFLLAARRLEKDWHR